MDIAQSAVGGVVLPHIDGLGALIRPQPLVSQGVQSAVGFIALYDGADLRGQRAVFGKAQAVAVWGNGLGENRQRPLPGRRQGGQGQVVERPVHISVLQGQQHGSHVVVILDADAGNGLQSQLVLVGARQGPQGSPFKVSQRFKPGLSPTGVRHHHHDAAVVVWLREVHPLRPLLGDGKAGGSQVIFSRLDAGDKGGEFHIM